MTNIETKTVRKPLVERVQDELIKRFINADWHEITLDMKKTGHKVTITPCTQGPDITKLEDVEYFLVNSPELPWLGGDTIESISEQIANYDKYIEENKNSKSDIRKFYDANLAGHTAKELHDGNEYFEILYDIWHKTDMSIGLYEMINAYDLSSIAKNNDSVDYIKAVLKLSNDYGFYSDWYKDLHGHRPHIEGDF